MSVHHRQLIRHKVKDILIAAATAAGARVYANRPAEGPASEYPRIHIWTLVEPARAADMTTKLRRRDLNIVIEARVKAGSDAMDDQLDQLALEIENAMKADHTLDGLVSESGLVNTEILMLPEGSPPVGIIGLQYEADYTF